MSPPRSLSTKRSWRASCRLRNIWLEGSTTSTSNRSTKNSSRGQSGVFERLHVGVQGTGPDPPVQGYGEAGRIPCGAVLTIVLVLGPYPQAATFVTRSSIAREARCGHLIETTGLQPTLPSSRELTSESVTFPFTKRSYTVRTVTNMLLLKRTCLHSDLIPAF